ncbi:hypothetical protein CAEBREN_01853 [Caenorhabditis brenneri]|uniref:Carboxylic ester hydrolase n=1 Tax=Caenorhabditis brenneri TaxID=135651 RepID=G0MXZ1_CAEBE|nr:hypothetical protein CAEBREN_01853 [Caenorhabditis brenneri]
MGGHLSHLKPERHSNSFLASCGPVLGNVYRHGDKSVDGFLGIPYAKPPIGDLRFRKPVLADVWHEPKDCTQYGPRCPSSGMFYEKIDLKNQDQPDEANCLTLNVFRPRWQSKEYIKRPVMVFIHGGGFELCASRDYCDYSLTGTLPLKDVVVVTINYRLGSLGFFSTGDETCRGNFGLWDQTLALVWVQKHISSFGGDPNNVTIFGQSAGGVSVDLLSLSPHSRGSNELYEFMRNLSMEKLLERTGFEHSTSGMVSFGPNVDGDFFPKPLDELRKEASKKPVLIGMTEHEGLLFAFSDPYFTTADDVLKKKIPMEYKEDVVENPEEYQKEVFDYYMNYIQDSNEKKLVAYTGDSIFNAGVLLAAEKLRYILGEGVYSKFEPNYQDLEMMDYMTTAFSNFAKYGYFRNHNYQLLTQFFSNPNTAGLMNWERYELNNDSRHFHITFPESQMRQEFHEGRCQFLKETNKRNKGYLEIFFGKNN